jgi:hypothetical protein
MPEAGWYDYAREFASSHTFYYLALVCTFPPETPQAKGDFVRAGLGLQLKNLGADGPPPIARFISQDSQDREVTQTIKIGARVKTGPIDIHAEKETSSVTASRERTIEGHGASQSTPTWTFCCLNDSTLERDRRVAALIETAPGSQNVAEALLSADLEYRRLGIVRYRANLTRDHVIRLA